MPWKQSDILNSIISELTGLDLANMGRRGRRALWEDEKALALLKRRHARCEHLLNRRHSLLLAHIRRLNVLSAIHGHLRQCNDFQQRIAELTILYPANLS